MAEFPWSLMTVDDELDIQSLGQFYQSMPARLLENNLNLNNLRTNPLLDKDGWEQLDSHVVTIASDVLNAIADLRAMGLTVQLGGLGILVSQYEQINDMTDDEEDRLNFPLLGVPVPIISKGFRIDARSLTATQKVAEKLEQLFFSANILIPHFSSYIQEKDEQLRTPLFREKIPTFRCPHKPLALKVMHPRTATTVCQC